MRLLRSLFSAGQVFLLLSITAAALAKTAQQPPVTITDTGTNYILANGYVTASISKTTGDMVSLKYHGLETMGYVSGHHAGYWEQNPSGAVRKADAITIDPAKNNGERGEVSIKGWSDGQSLTAHPVPDPGATNEDSASQLNGRHVGPPPGSGRHRTVRLQPDPR